MEPVDVSFERKDGEAWVPSARLAGLKGTITEVTGRAKERATAYLAGVTHCIQVPFVRGGVPVGARVSVGGKAYLVGAAVQVGESIDVFVDATVTA